MPTDDGSLYYLPNARTPAQRAQMAALQADGVCIFCPDGLAASGQEVLHRTAHWSVTPNGFPYEGTLLHLLLIPGAHVTDMLSLPDDARQDLWAALGWVRDTFALGYYGFGVRNGDSARTGGTVRHLHAHVIVADPAAADDVPVRLSFRSRRR